MNSYTNKYIMVIRVFQIQVMTQTLVLALQRRRVTESVRGAAENSRAIGVRRAVTKAAIVVGCCEWLQPAARDYRDGQQRETAGCCECGLVRVRQAVDGGPRRVMDGWRLRVTWAVASDVWPPRLFSSLERKVCEFARKPVKQCKTCSSATHDTRNLGSMALREAAPAPPAPGPLCESESRTPCVVLRQPASRGGQRQVLIMDGGLVSGPNGHAVSPGPVAAPTLSSHRIARATHCELLPTAVSPSTPLTRLALALVFLV